MGLASHKDVRMDVVRPDCPLILVAIDFPKMCQRRNLDV